jgi:hypothetical protein
MSFRFCCVKSVCIDELTVFLWLLANCNERKIHISKVHSIMSYGIIFWGGSSYAKKVFILQKRIIRNITNAKPTDSCREIFVKLEIMTLYSQYIYIPYYYIQL